ncbi:MAG: class I SAM-dependent methyltransferase [Actinomycetia bacterium]|nr:class I SAM-dependent methyltransferase [Actinomycetes bacterium]
MREAYGACPLCGGEGRVLSTVDCRQHPLWHEPLPPDLTWMRCGRCGHVYTRHYWTEAGLAEVFARTHAFQVAGGDPDQKRQVWKSVVANVVALVGGYRSVLRMDPVPTWLDVGCGDGALVMAAEEFGFRAVGVDARRQTVEILQGLGYRAVVADFVTGTIDEQPLVISMMDVLEHLPWPVEALERARTLLPPGGVLVVSLPNADSSSWRIMDKRQANPYWIEIEHHHNFTRGRLTQLLEDTGFDVVLYEIPYRYKAQMELYALRT